MKTTKKESQNSEVKVIVDTREMKSRVVKKLFELGAKIESKQLPVGDFILSDKVAVERKTVRDFLQSIIDNRLFNQISNLNENFEKPVIIVEGTEDMYSIRMMHPNAIRGAIASLAIDFKIPIIQTTGEEETALFLYMIASREQIDKKISISLHGERKPLEGNLLQEYIVSSFPGVGKELAQKLLLHFKSIKNIVNADIKELKKVEKIGEKKAKKIRAILDREYEK
jgi:ERCC4-type nuclease